MLALVPECLCLLEPHTRFSLVNELQPSPGKGSQCSWASRFYPSILASPASMHRVAKLSPPKQAIHTHIQGAWITDEIHLLHVLQGSHLEVRQGSSMRKEENGHLCLCGHTHTMYFVNSKGLGKVCGRWNSKVTLCKNEIKIYVYKRSLRSHESTLPGSYSFVHQNQSTLEFCFPWTLHSDNFLNFTHISSTSYWL